ncbi:hypothetical protein AB0D04_35095 [Streptomyces sp. NPDC048483]|uniref:hypothetical protein n=1 Tax=Streptomyces sp. NPDC048483 TaxID=3154927 RepID=UPI0034374902
MPAPKNSQDIFDLDIREIADPTEEANSSVLSSGIPTLCSNECTGDCCTIAGC